MNAASQATAAGMGELSGRARTAISIMTGVLEGIAVGEVVKDFTEFHSRVIEQTADFENLANRLQITTSQYQALRLAAINAGTTQGEMQQALFRFNATIGAAEQGNKQAIGSFQQLGIKILDASGKVRPMTDLLAEAARALLQMEDGSLKARLEMQLFYRTGVDLNPMLEYLAGGVDALQQKFARGIVDPETIAKLKQLQNQANIARANFDAFYASVGGPVYLGAITKISEALRGLEVLMDRVATGWASLGAGAAAPQVENLQKRIAEAQARLDAHPNARGADKLAAEIAADREKLAIATGHLAAAEVTLATARDRQKRAESGLHGGPVTDPTDPMAGLAAGGAVNVTKTTGASNPGGDKTKSGPRDRIQEAIAQYEAQAAAARKALGDLMHIPADANLKDAEEAIQIQQKIDDAIAKAAKTDPNDPRLGQLRQQITLSLQTEAAERKLQRAMQDADQLEKSSGDGTAYLRDEMERLNAALDTGRLNYDTYAVAVKAAQDKAEAMRLTLAGQQEGFRGLVAGMEYAAAQWAKQNRSFEQGQKIFQSVTQAMSTALTDFVSKGKVDFASLLGSFLSMIAQMEAQAAASALFGDGKGGGVGGIGGLIGDALGSLFGGGDSIQALTNQANMNIASGAAGAGGAIGGFASGGDPPVGVPSWVGEQGPELFVPKQAGTIFNRDQLAGMGGGGDVTINQTMVFGSDVSQATLRTWGQQVKNETIAAVLDKRRRAGKFKQTFAR
jgi:hypothetical protein